MILGWLRSFGNPPAWLQSRDRQVVLTHQGRTALGVLCSLLRLGPADEVLLPAYNCGAEVDPFVHAGCRVVFYRIDRSANADTADVLHRLTRDTKLIYVTHFFGWPQDMTGLAEVCRRRNLLLVSDCAQALFSEVLGNTIGSLSDAVIYSFPKSLAVPDGGALVLKPKLAAEIKGMRFPDARSTLIASLPLFKKWFMQSNGIWQQHPRSRHFLNRSWSPKSDQRRPHCRRKEMLSSNLFQESQRFWGMSRVSLGILKQTNVAQVVASRRRNFVYLQEQLNNRENLQPLYDRLPEQVCPHAYPVHAKTPGHARSYFRDHGILVQGWPGYYPGMPWDEFPEACALKDSLITLPVHQNLNITQMQYIAQCANRLGM